MPALMLPPPPNTGPLYASPPRPSHHPGCANRRMLLSLLPPPSSLSAGVVDRVANMFLAYRGRNGATAGHKAAQDIARQSARQLLGPLLDTAAARMCFVLRKVADLAIEKATATGPRAGWGRAGPSPLYTLPPLPWLAS